MTNLKIINGEIIAPDKLEKKDLFITNGVVSFNCSAAAELIETIDATGCYISPGLFDLQVNGSSECDLWDKPNIEQFAALCVSMLKNGITAFLPTLITGEIEHLKRNIHFLESLGVGGHNSPSFLQILYALLGSPHSQAGDLIYLPGIHLEGPYLSPARYGAHPPQLIKKIDMSELAKLVCSPVKLVTLAPELDNGMFAIDYLVEHGIKPSLGHSNANYFQAEQAFSRGVKIVTHIFNALPPILQRDPGAVVAALVNDNVYCCVICDGLHVDPEMVRLLVKTKGRDKVILVTDIAHIGTTSGGLIGSSINLSQAVANIVNWGIVSFPEAIRMASLNPARAMGLDNIIGEIRSDGRPDLVLWDKKTLKVKHVIANGRKII